MYFGSGNIACTPINPFWNVYWSNNTALIANGTSILSSYGRMANVRFEYMDKILARDYPDSSTSLLQSCPQIVGQNLSWNSGISGGFNPKNPYVISFLKTMSS